MANELQNLMNKAVQDFLVNDAGIVGATYTYFKVRYNKVSQQMYFGNTYDGFVLPFQDRIDYNVSCSAIIGDKQPDNVWEQYTNWGLPSYLGFDKKEYTGIETSGNVLFNYDSSNVWLSPDPTYLIPSQTAYAYYVVAPKTISLFGDSAIYMEFDKFNTIDELVPYAERTNNMYNNDYSGKVKSAFAKIPITVGGQSSQIFDSRNLFLQNVSQYHPPIDRIKKVKFKFRYHDGRLVDFKVIQIDGMDITDQQEFNKTSLDLIVGATYFINDHIGINAQYSYATLDVRKIKEAQSLSGRTLTFRAIYMF